MCVGTRGGAYSQKSECSMSWSPCAVTPDNRSPVHRLRPPSPHPIQDFLAPDDDEPEAPPRKPSAPKQAPAPATAPRAKKRTVLLDSDDDE